MAKLSETIKEKKARRNKAVLDRYIELKNLMTCREAQKLLEDEFNISKSTVTKILFVPSYSLSPLPTIVATTVVVAETKSVPV
ncbi:hypothetical protein GR160_03030 [Flavobacterium sp. Sd200]|uniref:hypothetical protein n=1 Tax=Flavobacterium sp. Sd200 TaxID=2692211 RepID=UPI00136BE24F|nr:hypothetical protein [Flavobacterium sp. Sd200]MXN90188.1 hypothetical protein [Flavobacterium sp. Sd200]